MSLERVTLGHLSVSRLLIGGNSFSGFSHQTAERSAEMRAYYIPERIHATLRQAESLGIHTILGRADAHIVGVLKTYHPLQGGLHAIPKIQSISSVR